MQETYKKDKKMHLKNIIQNKKVGVIAQTIDLKEHTKQVVIICLDAGQDLKPHISKTDAILIVEKGTATFTLWHDEKPNEFVINEHDMVGFKANQLHGIHAAENFIAIVIK
jgi:quercetin dioxygenase-like cupin family protein